MQYRITKLNVPCVLILCLTSCDFVDRDYTGGDTALELAWTSPRATHSSLATAPRIYKDNVYVTHGSVIQSLDIASGNVVWTASLPLPSSVPRGHNGHVLVDEQAVYIYQISAWIHAVSREDGQTLWHADFPETVIGTSTEPLDAGETILVPVFNEVLRIDKSTGHLSTLSILPSDENQRIEVPFYGSLDGNGDLCLAVGYLSNPAKTSGVWDGGGVYLIDGQTGAIHWEFHPRPVTILGQVVQQHPIACVTWENYYAVVANHDMFGLDPDTGSELWNKGEIALASDAFAFSPVSNSGNVMYVPSVRQRLYSVDITTGKTEWMAHLPGSSFFNEQSSVTDSHVYIRGFGHALLIIDKHDGQVLQTKRALAEEDYIFASWPATSNSHLVLQGIQNIYSFRIP